MTEVQIVMNGSVTATVVQSGSPIYVEVAAGPQGPQGPQGSAGPTGPPGPNVTDQDIEVTDPNKGNILRSPGGNRGRITMNDDYTLNVMPA